MELIGLVIVAVIVWAGMALLHSATDRLDGCSCLMLIVAGIGIAVVIASCMTLGWS